MSGRLFGQRERTKKIHSSCFVFHFSFLNILYIPNGKLDPVAVCSRVANNHGMTSRKFPPATKTHKRETLSTRTGNLPGLLTPSLPLWLRSVLRTPSHTTQNDFPKSTLCWPLSYLISKLEKWARVNLQEQNTKAAGASHWLPGVPVVPQET